jgi:hypothetical protein
MSAVLARLLLLLLLGVDWAADPSLVAPALQLLARPLASTENLCPSVAYREAVRKESAPAPQAAPAPRPHRQPAPRPRPGLPAPAVALSVDLVYVLMSIRR